jgi:RNA polymerase sigma factor (sigma-70 family)
MSGEITERIRDWLLKLGDGDPKAKEALLAHTQERLTCIARRMLHGGFARLRSVEETGDVAQDAYARLLKGWDGVVTGKDNAPVSVDEYFRRVTQLIREVLIDLARRHYGRGGRRPGTVPLDARPDDSSAGAGFDPGTDTLAPATLDLFTDFHRAIEALPENQRRVFDLHWYQGLTHQETALVMGVAEVTVRKYWVAARLTLQEKFKDNPFKWKPLG